jgi:ATP-dependent Clp protease ATP-binding subunit ClpC
LFKPEFLNRLDDIIVFHQLERNDLVKIVDLEVAKVIERVRAKDIKVQLDRSAVEFLIDKGYDPTYGARPMRRAVEKFLEDPLAECSCEETSSRATRSRSTRLVNNWR